MGCDIHIVLEQYHEGEWLGIWASEFGPSCYPKIVRRDYAFFSFFGVRRSDEDTEIAARGLPDDASRLARAVFAAHSFHSASYATPEEFCGAWVRANQYDSEVIPEYATQTLLGIYTEPGDPPHRVVFWFDS